MDPQLYEAGQSGDWDVIKNYGAKKLDSQRTPNRNTILHVLAQFCDKSFAVGQVLSINQSLLRSLNEEKETSLHIAARNGHFSVAEKLIHCSGEFGELENTARENILRMKNMKGDTALHLAVRNNRYKIVELFVKKDPHFVYPPNAAGETPLYLAVERGYHRMANLILANCKEPSYDGPYGRTALHAATITNSEESVKLLLRKLPNLTNEKDSYGWTALHFAARFNHQKVAKLLLQKDKSLAYVKSDANDSRRTALHISVIHGSLDVIEELLSHCPDCWEMVTRSGENILHLAVKNEQKLALNFILLKSWASQLINGKDDEGNTPLHLYTSTKILDGSKLVNHRHLDKNATNGSHLTPLDMVMDDASPLSDRKKLIKSELEKIGANFGFRPAFGVSTSTQPEGQPRQKKDNIHSIVPMLLVTITFAAGFTILGGFVTVLRNNPFIVVIFASLAAMLYSMN